MNNLSHGQEKAIELAPELMALYERRKQQREVKYHEDWDISGLEKECFEPYKNNGLMVTR